MGEGQIGPLVRRLESHGRLLCGVEGSWQKASKDLHSLLNLLADSKVQALGLARGREATERERSQILSGYWWILSTTAARATSGCLLGEWPGWVRPTGLQLGGEPGPRGRGRDWRRRGGPMCRGGGGGDEGNSHTQYK